MPYICLLLILLISFTLNTMEQLSPRSTGVVRKTFNVFQEECDQVGIGVMNRIVLLQALTKFGQTINWNLPSDEHSQPVKIEGFENFVLQLQKEVNNHAGKIVGVAQDYYLEQRWDAHELKSKVIKHYFQDDKEEQLFEYALVDRMYSFSDSIFAVWSSSSISIIKDREVVFRDTVADDFRSSPVCFNATGTVLAYPKRNIGALSDELVICRIESGETNFIPIDCLKVSYHLNDSKNAVCAALACNLANPREMLCLSAVGTLYIIDIEASKVVHDFRVFSTTGCKSLCVSPDGRYVAAASDRNLKIWDGDNEILDFTFNKEIKALLFSSNGNYLAIKTELAVKFLAISDLKILDFTLDGCKDFWFIPGGQFCLVKSADKKVNLWSSKFF